MPSTTFSDYLPSSERVIYVDATNGNDANRGNIILEPVQTLSTAFNKASNNSIIVLQNGNYGSLTVSNKNLFLLGAYGSSPAVTNVNAVDAHLNFYNISFSGASTGISLTNSLVNKGSVSLRKCSFDSIDLAVELVRCKTISMHQNAFSNCSQSVIASFSNQATISSNVVDSADVAFNFTGIEQLDFYHNTISGSNPLGSGIPDDQLHVVYHTITAQDVLNKYVVLSDFIYSVAINVVNGSSLGLGDDFIFNGNLILWEGLGLESTLNIGDVLRIAYTQNTDPTVGSAIILNSVGANSRIDSNNITDAVVGVFLSPDIKVTYNNFFNTTMPVDGSTPGVYVGNITGDPDYVGGGDFHIGSSSASLGQANPDRWEDVFQEMSVFNKWDAAYFNRNLDRDDVNRFHLVGHVTGSIGAYEFISDSFNPVTTDAPAFIAEYGYDFSHFGGLDDPFYTPDRGFNQTSTNPIRMLVGDNAGKLITNTGRFTTNNWELSSAPFEIGSNLTGDFAVIYPTYPNLPTTDNVYVSEDGGDEVTGSITGDGSSSAPFRSIDRALEEMSSNIILLPGRYKKFTQGQVGKRIIPLKRPEFIATSKKIYTQFASNSWDVDVTGTVEPQLETRTLTFDHSVNSGTAAVNSVFNLVNDTNGIEVKFKVLIGTNLHIEIYTDPPSAICVPPTYPPNTPDNMLFFEINGTEISVGHKKLTTEDTVQKCLSFPAQYDLTEFELAVTFLIKGPSFTILVKGNDVDIKREGEFENFYNDPFSWKIRFTSDDPTPSFSDDLTEFSDLKLIAGDFTGVTGFGESTFGYALGRGPSILAGK